MTLNRYQTKFIFFIKSLNVKNVPFRRNLRQKLLLFVICLIWIYFVLLWTRKSPHQKIISKKINVFVIKSFLYEKSKSFDGNNAIVTLFNSEHDALNTTNITCRRTLTDGTTELTKGQVQDLVNKPHQTNSLCKLTIYRLLCQFPDSKRKLTQIYEVGIFNNLTKQMDYNQLKLSQPDKKKRGFVSCMSRMVAFDDWALLLFAVETFKFYGGDLMVSYVNCALKQVIDLMKLYEKDGILMIKPGYQSYKPKSLSYDPDSEVEFAHQITNAHECLYEFKESTDFIALIDWDDVLMGPKIGQQFMSYKFGFNQLSKQFPFAGVFSIQRKETYLTKPFEKNTPYNLEVAVQRMNFYDKALQNKIVVRPKRVAGTWIHTANLLESNNFEEISINQSDATIFHVQNLISGGKADKSIIKHRMIGKVDKFINGSILQENLMAFFTRHRFNFDSSTYPDFKTFYELIYNCYETILARLERLDYHECPSHRTCKYPKQDLEVIKIETKYRPSVKTGNVTWFERSTVEFVQSNTGCL